MPERRRTCKNTTALAKWRRRLKVYEWALMMRRECQIWYEADTLAIGWLLGLLQFVGGLYLLAPSAQLIPPFIKLFGTFPPIVWVLYFAVAGFAQMFSSTFAHHLSRQSIRLNIATWTACNWLFLTVTSVMTYLVMSSRGEIVMGYGISQVFYPCLFFAALWKCYRLMENEHRARVLGLHE